MDDNTSRGGIEAAATPAGWHAEDRGAGIETGRPDVIVDRRRDPFVTGPGADLIGSLSLCERLSATLTGPSQDWKWCLLSAHSALKACVVLVVTADNASAAYTMESRLRADKDWAETEETVALPLEMETFKHMFFSVTAAKEDRASTKPLRLDKYQVYAIMELDDVCQALVDLDPSPRDRPAPAFEGKPQRMAASIMAAMDAIVQLRQHPGLSKDSDLGPAIGGGVMGHSAAMVRSHMSRFY